MSDNSPPFSLARVLLIAIPAALLAWGVKSYTDGFQQKAREDSVRSTVRQMLGQETLPGGLAESFRDEDGDLVADPPEKIEDCIDPEEIVFSYYASTEEGNDRELWKPFTDALSERLDRPVRYVHFADVEEQLRALKEGRLHITALGTGAAAVAVSQHGFVPICCFADASGAYGYTMKIIVPAKSKVEKVEQLRGGRITFTRPRSNSGYKAALVMLMNDHNMRPERDYSWGFSYGHDNSILGVADQTYEAAAVASDVLARMIARDDLDGTAIRAIYESEGFPPGVIGYAYNLTPELREGIREALLELDVAETDFAEQYGAGEPIQLAPVNYAEDWAPVRRVNEAVAAARAGLE